MDVKRKIKVGFITDDIDRKAMGTALYMQKLIEQYAKNFKDEVELVLIHREGKCLMPECSYARQLPIKTFKLPKWTGITSFVRFFLTCPEEFDIIHFPRPKLFPFFWKLKSKAFVVTFHDAPEKGSVRYRTPANYIFEWFITLWARHHIDAAIGDADFAAMNIWRYFNLDPRKTFGVPLANTVEGGDIPDGEVEAAREMLKNKYGIASPYILQIGRLVPHKNPHRVVEGFDILKRRTDLPHTFVILGGRNHSPSYDRIFDATMGRIRHKDAVYIAPYIETSDLGLVYRCADMFVQAGTSDGFSIPIVDAMRRGVPVVTSNLSVFPEIVGDAAVLVNPYDPADIADGMARTIDDPTLKQRLIELGRERGERYSWERTARETIAIYQKVLSRRNR